MMVRNGARTLGTCLDSMQRYCDTVYALEDRSQDGTRAILENHPLVSNIFSAPRFISGKDWFFSESLMLELLYRMSDFYLPDWVMVVDSDEILSPGVDLRGILARQPPEVVAVKARKRSVWNDPLHPLMVPLMGQAESIQGDTWRYFPGLKARGKQLHNCRLPEGIENRGRVVTIREILFHHDGWGTLQERIEKVDAYTAIDPTYELNEGVPYDKALLFGYKRAEVNRLIHDYHCRFQEHQSRNDRPSGPNNEPAP